MYNCLLPKYVSKFGKVSSGHRTLKGFPILKKGSAKECSNYCTIALISHDSKVMLKFSKPGFNNTWTENFQMFKLDLYKAEEPEIKLLTSVGSYKKQESSKKASTQKSLTTSKPLTVWITTNCEKFLKRWEYRPPYLPGEISITSDMQMTPPLRQKAKKNQGASWWKWKRRVKKLA